MISGTNTSTHDLMIDVGILLGDDLAGIEQINFLTSSTDDGCRMSTGVPVNFTSAHRASICLPANVDEIPSSIDRILLTEYSAKGIQSFLFSPDEWISIGYVV